jgi:phage baseplate assembly protein gpV
MISKTLSRKTMAAFLSVAVLSVYSMIALASPEAKVPSGELSVSGQVTVNGEKVISGGTLFSDSVIVTSDKSSATVSISKLGRIQLAPNSSLTLSFTDKAITGLLDSGIANVSTLAGISVNLTTKDGSVVVDGSQATSFTVNAKRGTTVVSTEAGLVELRAGGAVKQVAAGESATAGTPNPQDPDDDNGISGGALVALVLAAAGVVIASIWATRDDEINFGGTILVISPSR